jgi:ferritin-like metal-binding protein YciE
MENIRDLFIHELQDTLHAEKQIVKALPKMVEAASSTDLKEAFQAHLQETEGQITRLEKVFEHLGQPVNAKKCEGMAGILKEGEELMEEEADEKVMDVALIAAAQKVEHYEIASYGCLCTWAELLNEEEVADLLKENLAEEEDADEKLSDLAESTINSAANTGEQEEEPAEADDAPSR